MDEASTSQTLVLLEDDPLQLQVLTLQLLAQALKARGCATPQQALQQVAAAPPGAVTLLMDVHIPNMQPLEFCRQVRALRPGVRLVGCSASQPPPEVLAAFDQFVLKPADGPALSAAAFPGHANIGEARAYINIGTFENLARSMSPAMLRSLYAAYFKDAEHRLLAMESACSEKDAGAMQRSAHTLKGASGMLGVQAVAQAAFALETLDTIAFSQAPELLSHLHQRLDRARNAIQAKLDTLTAPIVMVPTTTVSSTASLSESTNTK